MMAEAQKSSESTVQRILNAAIAEVSAYGSERTTVVSIARAAAMTHANIYRHYASKTALFDAITVGWLKNIEAQLGEIADAPDPARDKLERLISALFRAYRDRLDAEPRLFDLFVDAFRENRAPARQHRARLRMLLDRIFEEGLSTRSLSIKSREKAMMFVFDTLYRFLQPEAVRLDASIPRRSLEPRFALLITLILRSFTDSTV
jgi:AcrR family transcriptional regulator